ncbi:hypothetical protein [Nocardia sp. NPDC049707]|uniref:hypothetical protein n=1 Tax=Nocardia sp. NPDC049707 TaxID=3154735 RepID=UPI00342DAFD2
MNDTVGEFEAQATVEAVCARDADRLECRFHALEYRAAGDTLMQEWITDSRARLKTTTAIRIADVALTTSPLKWRQCRQALDTDRVCREIAGQPDCVRQ